MIVLCHGDSLTAGAYGVSYADELLARLPPGIELRARGLLGARAQELARDYASLGVVPDVLIVTVGTNEVLSGVSPSALRWLRRLRGEPVESDVASFESTLRCWLAPLAARTKVVLCGVAIAGMEGEALLAQRARAFNQALASIAVDLSGAYVDLAAAFAGRLALPAGSTVPFSRIVDSVRWRFERRWPNFRRPHDAGALTIDGVHWSACGAAEVAAEVARVVLPLLHERRSTG